MRLSIFILPILSFLILLASCTRKDKKEFNRIKPKTETVVSLKNLIDKNDTWWFSEGEYENAPFLLRFRPHLQPFIETKNYDARIIITWRYNPRNAAGFPRDKDLNLMEQFENTLVESLENDLEAVLSFIYTAKNKKEWHWYTKNLPETRERINSVLLKLKLNKLQIDISSEQDPEWTEYHAVLKETDTLSNNKKFR